MLSGKRNRSSEKDVADNRNDDCVAIRAAAKW